MSTLPKTGDSFIDLYAQDAIDSQRETGVPASVTLAQALIESNRGKSGLTRKALNFFGIKGEGTAGHILMPTREVLHGKSVMVDAKFRKYHTAKESFIDHGQFFIQNPRYKPALAVKHDAHEFARQIQRCGYATDPHYAQTLISIIDKYDLTRFDRIALGEASETQPESTQTPQTRPLLSFGDGFIGDGFGLNGAVRELQHTLNIVLPRLGISHTLVEDGKFGMGCEKGVRLFQGKVGLTPDGRCGEATWKALEESLGK